MITNIDKHIIKLCLKLLELKEGKLERSFIEMIGHAIGPKGRSRTALELLEDLVRLKQEKSTKNRVFINKDSSDRDIRSVFESFNWVRLLEDKRKTYRDLGYQIQKTIFSLDKIYPDIIQTETYSVDVEGFKYGLDNLMDLSMFNGMAIWNLLTKEVRSLVDRTDYKTKLYPESFVKLCKVFELDELQQKILYHYYLMENIPELDDFTRYTNLDYSDRKKAFKSLSKLLDVPLSQIKKELRTNGKLRQSMMIKITDTDIELKPHISAFLHNDDDTVDIFDYFFKSQKLEDSLNLKDHKVTTTELNTLKNLLKTQKGGNFLIYGPPGTGKTEFTRSLGLELNQNVYHIKTNDLDNENMVEEKRSALIAAMNILPKDSILVVDEAEEILDSGGNIFSKDNSDHKAWLNTFMESHKINLIWVTNDMTMHHSTKRRFDLAIKFDSFTKNQRLKALKTIQDKNNFDLFSEKELETLSRKYQLDPGALSLAFKKLSNVQGSDEYRKEMVFTMLNSQSKLLLGDEVSEKPVENFYNPDFLNTSINEQEIIGAVEKYFQSKGQIRNLCLLFQGVPGTGKTEYAKHISEALEKDMSVKRASDILSSMWGGTEKNIASIFRDAETNGDILFLDECDSLFKSRGSSEYSWMVSETNELLTQMERFKGVLICATNFVQNLDPAAMRRFHFKVEFKDLKAEKLSVVYQSFFGPLVSEELTDEQLISLQRIRGLNPGDFKAVYNSVLFKNNLSHEELIERLKQEVSYKQNKVSIGL